MGADSGRDVLRGDELAAVREEIADWMTRNKVSATWLSKIATPHDSAVRDLLIAGSCRRDRAEMLLDAVRRWPDGLPPELSPGRQGVKRAQPALSARDRTFARRQALRALLDPWCARTGTNIASACQYLFDNARALEGTAGLLPEDAEYRAHRLISDFPDGLDPRAAMLATSAARRRLAREARDDRTAMDFSLMTGGR